MLKVAAVVTRMLRSLMLLSLLSASVAAHSTDSITIISYAGYPPYLYHDDGKHTGLYVSIVDLTLKAIGQAYTLETLPFKRAIHESAAGDGVVAGILKTDKRMETLDFSEPFYYERIFVYFNQPQSPLITTVDQLDGLVVGKLLGWSYSPEFDRAKENNRFLTKNNRLEINFSLLAKGRLDAVIHSELSSAYMLKKLGLKNEVFLGSEPLSLGSIHFAVKKGTQAALIERINAKLNEVEHQRSIELLVDSYKKNL